MKVSENIPADKLHRKIHQLVEAGRPVVLTTYTFPHSMEVYMEQVLTIFLEIIQQKSIADHVVYFVKELMENAKKANTKRIYFNEKQLDINKSEDYQLGMKTFKNDIFENRKYYLALQEKEGLFIKLKLWKEEGTIKIEVSNNCRLTVYEETRMKDKLEMGRQYGSLEDALIEAADDTEGGGLGLIILVLMIKKMGVTQERIWVEKGEGETKIGVEIPVQA